MPPSADRWESKPRLSRTGSRWAIEYLKEPALKTLFVFLVPPATMQPILRSTAVTVHPDD
jgi:hypothetical protein